MRTSTRARTASRMRNQWSRSLLLLLLAWWSFARASDRTRVERFLQRTIRMGYLPPALPDAAVLVAETETRLLASVVLRPDHVLRQLSPPVIIRRPGLRPCPHNFVLPDKDDCNFIPRILYRTLLIYSSLLSLGLSHCFV